VDLNLNEVTVIHNERAHRFEAHVAGLRALIAYRRFPDRMVFTHTEVPPPLEGQGLAARLARAALDFSRTEGLRVVPLCPYVRSFIARHSEFHDLVSADDLGKLAPGRTRQPVNKRSLP
jgi:predicted GNAT family acetyltransferase